MTYDLITIGGGASGLFCALNAPKDSSKLILEKQGNLGTKILMSGGGRCNFSNSQISPETYFGENKKMLPSVFHKFSNNEMLNFLEANGVQTQQEDNGRLILKSGKAQELLDLLIKKTKENQTEIKLNQEIINIQQVSPISSQERGIEGEVNFIINTTVEKFKCKKLIIATGGVSHPNSGTTGYGLDLAKQFDLKIITPYPALCGIETNEDLTNLSGSSILSDLEVFHNSKLIYKQHGNILFTHKGLSGPSIFNATAAIGEYLSKKGKYNIQQLQNNISLNITVQPENITKRLKQSELLNSQTSNSTSHVLSGGSFGRIAEEAKNPSSINLQIKNISPIETAKVSGGGISMSEINPNFESKKIPNLYFIGETLDITGQTGGFNLQWAWSNGYVCGKNL